MMQIINMFWIVVIFWLLIEVINSRLNRTRKNTGPDNHPDHVTDK